MARIKSEVLGHKRLPHDVHQLINLTVRVTFPEHILALRNQLGLEASEQPTITVNVLLSRHDIIGNSEKAIEDAARIKAAQLIESAITHLRGRNPNL